MYPLLVFVSAAIVAQVFALADDFQVTVPLTIPPLNESLIARHYSTSSGIATYTYTSEYLPIVYPSNRLITYPIAMEMCQQKLGPEWSLATFPHRIALEKYRTAMLTRPGWGGGRDAWTGGTDDVKEGDWYWNHGRLKGQMFALQARCRPMSIVAANGTVVVVTDANYASRCVWDSNAPDNAWGGQHYAFFFQPGNFYLDDALKDEPANGIACERSPCEADLDCWPRNTIGASGYYPLCTCACKPGYTGSRCELRELQTLPNGCTVIDPFAFESCATVVAIPGNADRRTNSECQLCALGKQSRYPCDATGVCMCATAPIPPAFVLPFTYCRHVVAVPSNSHRITDALCARCAMGASRDYPCDLQGVCDCASGAAVDTTDRGCPAAIAFTHQNEMAVESDATGSAVAFTPVGFKPVAVACICGVVCLWGVLVGVCLTKLLTWLFVRPSKPSVDVPMPSLPPASFFEHRNPASKDTSHPKKV